MQRVEEIIDELGLKHCQHVQIGSVLTKTISGGERKRVSIGVELVTDPSLIVLDEPTSGLDSFRATAICQILHKMAREKGKTIIAAIHQPSSQSFEYFDRLILMSEGSIVFQGTAMRSQRYFGQLGFNMRPFTNPAD